MQVAWADIRLPAAVVVSPPPVPALLRFNMTLMGVGAFVYFGLDLRRWIGFESRHATAAP